MKKTKYNVIAFCGTLLLSCMLNGCAGKAENAEKTPEVRAENLAAGELAVLHDEEFGGAYLQMTIDDFIVGEGAD